MKLGYFTLTDNPPAYGASRQDPNVIIKNTLTESIHAEELGYHSVWVPEHHLGVFGVLPSPSMFLSYVAAVTKKVELAPATVLLPVNNPLRMAEEYSLLNLMSNGRAIFSAGRGYDEREYELFGIDFHKSREIFFEQLDVINKAWTQKKFDHHGEFFHYDDVELVPHIGEKAPEIYVASFSRPSVEKAAEDGFNCIFAPFAAAMVFGDLNSGVSAFQELSTQHGYKDKKVKCSYFINIADNQAELEDGAQRMLKYFKGIIPAFPSDPDKAPPSIRYFVDIVNRLQNMQTTDLSEKSILNGSSEQIVEWLKNVESSGLDEVILYFNFGGQDHKRTMQQMERAAKEILPHFHK